MSYLILFSVVLVRAVTDVMFKFAVNHLHFKDVSSVLPNLKALLKSPFIWIGLLFAILNVSLWTLCLTFFDLSFAYPFMSISFITIILCGKFFFNEHLGPHKIVGISFIALGALILFIE
ncbi:MAG: multidrug transporter EmrE-like cation transporter [Candidatus Marinamargulisbacteria bacterium]|jgi:multidrug transporter EmrE-like cation transporter